ncbi:hypothetical protein BGX30_012577 [Mortierella sp. GBA39]|nr:hypothetical protein BGX30_012577 [Mortierella sp. GBA39]
MRQEVPDPNSPFSDASDIDDLISYESEDLQDYPSDSDLPSYTTDIDHHHNDDDHDHDSDLVLSSFSSPRHDDNESTATTSTVLVAAEDSALLALASLQLEQGPLLALPGQSRSLALAEDLTTPDSDPTQQQQVQSVQSAFDVDGNSNNNNQQAQDGKDDRSNGGEHDFLLVDERDAVTEVLAIAPPSDSTHPQQQQLDQRGPESISQNLNENAAFLDTAPDVVPCQESRCTDLPAGQQSTTRTVQLHADVPAREEGLLLSTPPSASAPVSQLFVAATRVHQPHTEAVIPHLATLDSTESTGGHRSLRIKITGRDLTDDASTRIQEKITTNFILQHKHQHTSGIPRPCFVTKSAESAAAEVAQNESTDLCVYVLPASGPTRHDAQNLLQFAQALIPLLILVSSEDYLDPFTAIDLRQQLATHLRQPRSRRIASAVDQQVYVILQSCFTMQELLSIYIQRLVDGCTPVQASVFDSVCEKWRIVKEFMSQGLYVGLVWGTKLQDHLTTGVGVFFVALTVMLAIVVGTNMGSGTFSQPSHANIRHIDYVQNGRMGVAHVDFLTAKSTPYKGKHRHPFHVRILGDDKAWSVRGAPTESTPGVGDPIVQDLGNGTFKIYVALLRKHHPQGTAPADVTLSSWLCRTKTQHFMHIWFANGTRVPLTPRELVWPKRVVVPPTDRVPTHTPPDRLDDFEDDEDEDANQTWKDQLQRLSSPMVKHLSKDTVKWMNQQWGLLQPVLCDVHDMTNSALSYTFHSAKRLFFLFSSWVDQLFGRQDYSATRSWDVLTRAHQGAHQLKDRFFERCSSKGKQRQGKGSKEQKDLSVLLDEQFQSFKRSGQAAAEAVKLPTAETVLQKMDDLMVGVEDQVEKFLKSKRVQAMAERMNAEEILKRADKIMADEDRMEKVWKTEKVQDVHSKVTKRVEKVLQTQFAQDVNKKVAGVIKSKVVQDASERIQRKVEKLAATPAGKWIHRMEAHNWRRKEKKAKRPLGWFRKRYQRAFNR